MLDCFFIITSFLYEFTDDCKKESAANMIEHDGKKFTFNIEDGCRGKIVRISEVISLITGVFLFKIINFTS